MDEDTFIESVSSIGVDKALNILQDFVETEKQEVENPKIRANLIVCIENLYQARRMYGKDRDSGSV